MIIWGSKKPVVTNDTWAQWPYTQPEMVLVSWLFSPLKQILQGDVPQL